MATLMDPTIHPMALQVLQALIGLAAVAVMSCYADRLRVLHWRTHLWRVVGMHAAWAIWLGWLSFRAFTAGDVDLYNMIGIAGAAFWLAVSAPTWRGGPPGYTQSGPAPLGGPELQPARPADAARSARDR